MLLSERQDRGRAAGLDAVPRPELDRRHAGVPHVVAGLQRHRVVLGNSYDITTANPGTSRPSDVGSRRPAERVFGKLYRGQMRIRQVDAPARPGRGLAGRLFPGVPAGRLFPEARPLASPGSGRPGLAEDLGSLIPPPCGQRSKIFWQRPRPDRCVITTATTATSVTTDCWAPNATGSSRVDGAIGKACSGDCARPLSTRTLTVF